MTKARASQAPAPFLKWVGGKRQLLTEIEKRAPKNYDKYLEPFLGGGSVLFNFTPHIRFLSVRSEVCLQLPPDSTSRWTPLLFSYVLRRCLRALGTFTR